MPADLHPLGAGAQAEHEAPAAQFVDAARLIGQDQRGAAHGIGDRTAHPARLRVLGHGGERDDRRAVVELAGPGGVEPGGVGRRGDLDRIGHPARQHAHPTSRHARTLPACNAAFVSDSSAC
jgi:hypothetical protein